MHMKANFAAPPGPTRYLFTGAQYERMSELGFFEGKRVQLIGGEIIEMPAQSNKHFAMIDRARRILEGVFEVGFWVRAQGTLNLDPQGIPDPDIAVTVGDADQPADDNPTTAVLIVEVSDSRLWFDRTIKASMYAATGIKDYWVINVQARQLEVRRDPQPDATTEFGFSYGSLTTLKPGDTATPLAAPNGVVPVDQLFF